MSKTEKFLMIVSYHLNQLKFKLIYKYLKLRYPRKIQKDDVVICHGVGYPHWKNSEFICNLVFDDEYILIKNGLKVSSKDFRVK